MTDIILSMGGNEREHPARYLELEISPVNFLKKVCVKEITDLQLWVGSLILKKEGFDVSLDRTRGRTPKSMKVMRSIDNTALS